MLPRLDQNAYDRFLAEHLASFEAMQSLHQDKALAILPDHDRGLLAYLKYALRHLLDGFGVERQPPFGRHIDVLDRNCSFYKHLIDLHLEVWPGDRQPHVYTVLPGME